MTYTVNKERSNEIVTWFTVNEPNAKGETLVIELHRCKNPGGKNALPELWKKHGYINRILDTYIGIETYCTDSEGNCYGRYNPQTKLSDDGKRNVINFDWMFEDTEENEQKLIDEVLRLFSSATGKSATEEKIEKINEYAKENSLEIVFEKPNGWRELHGIFTPYGSVVITDRKTFKQKGYTKMLYVYGEKL